MSIIIFDTAIFIAKMIIIVFGVRVLMEYLEQTFHREDD